MKPVRIYRAHSALTIRSSTLNKADSPDTGQFTAAYEDVTEARVKL